MIGGIVITHASFGEGIKEAVEMIIGPQKGFEAVRLREGEGLMELVDNIKEKVVTMGTEDNFLFVDLFGATPFNAASFICAEKGWPVLTGVNMNILMEFLIGREQSSREELLDNIKLEAKKGFRIICQKDIQGQR